MKIFKQLSEILATEKATLNLEAAKKRDTHAGFYAECGKDIYEISSLYPANETDAAIIFEEWCKGVLSTCRPDHKILREYAEYTADPFKFSKWVATRTKE